MVSQSEVVYVTEEGAKSTCPICGRVNRCVWSSQGNLRWHPEEKDHCPHFRGMYHVDFERVEAMYSK